MAGTAGKTLAPFDLANFPALLNGRQVSIVNFSEVKKLFDLRIDSEYWCQDFIDNSNLISSTKRIREFNKCDIQNITSSPINKDFKYLEISNISLNDGSYQTIKVYKGKEPDRAHYYLKKNDVVISTVRPNRNAVAFISEDGIIGSSGLCVLRAKNISPIYLYLFCKTNYFIKCLVRANKATMYPAVSNSDVLNIPIFVPNRLEPKLEKIVKKSFYNKEKSTILYEQAQDLLLTELGLNDWQPKHQLTFIRNYSDTIHAERIDAEYFQPKYDEIINAIKSYKDGWDTLESLVTLKNSNFTPSDTKTYQYIELANIAGNGEITDCTTDEGQNLPTRARRKVNTGDVIVSSIEGSLSSIAIIEEEYNDGLCSTGFHAINSNHLNSETLLIFLKSFVGQLQLKRGCSGTILTAINQEEFGRIILPNISQSKQQEIQQKVAKSFELRRQSKQLLENAKRAVEIAIEQDEATALEWLQQKSEKTPKA